TAVFRHLRVSPSQLHPNSLVFLWAFEVTAAYLGIVPTLKLFFHAFGLQRSCPKGDKTKGKVPKGVEKESSKHGRISFKQRKGLFKMFEESVCGFKEKYYGVRSITSKGWKSIVYRGAKKDEDGNVIMGPHGQPVEDTTRKIGICGGQKPTQMHKKLLQ
ncbi:hypothetical protein A2U01_0047137, partial [Trifolium medium]|nr:hypothetical protein [Trifolium medium]